MWKLLLNNLFPVLNLIALIILSLWGRAWVNNQKAKLEKDIEKLKASYSKELFIHKLQFEKEFTIYDYLWMKVAHFRRAAENYFDIMPVFPKEKSEFFDPFVKEIKDVYETITIREPFLAEEVYEKTKKLVDISVELLARFKNPINADLDELREIRARVFDICAEIERAIRGRINNMGKAKLFE